MANRLWNKEMPETVYILKLPHEMRTYTNVGSLSAALSNGMRTFSVAELYVFNSAGKIDGDELQKIYDGIPTGTPKRSSRIADAIRSRVLLGALRRGEM